MWWEMDSSRRKCSPNALVILPWTTARPAWPTGIFVDTLECGDLSPLLFLASIHRHPGPKTKAVIHHRTPKSGTVMTDADNQLLHERAMGLRILALALITGTVTIFGVFLVVMFTALEGKPAVG